MNERDTSESHDDGFRDMLEDFAFNRARINGMAKLYERAHLNPDRMSAELKHGWVPPTDGGRRAAELEASLIQGVAQAFKPPEA